MRNLYDSSQDIEMINRLKSVEVDPPKGLWDDIEATLLAKRKRRFFIITSWASAATIAVLFTIGGFYYVNVKDIAIVSNNQKGFRLHIAKVTCPSCNKLNAKWRRFCTKCKCSLKS